MLGKVCRLGLVVLVVGLIALFSFVFMGPFVGAVRAQGPAAAATDHVAVMIELVDPPSVQVYARERQSRAAS